MVALWQPHKGTHWAPLKDLPGASLARPFMRVPPAPQLLATSIMADSFANVTSGTHCMPWYLHPRLASSCRESAEPYPRCFRRAIDAMPVPKLAADFREDGFGQLPLPKRYAQGTPLCVGLHCWLVSQGRSSSPSRRLTRPRTKSTASGATLGGGEVWAKAELHAAALSHVVAFGSTWAVKCWRE